MMKAIILGCGASGGVPLITGSWGTCDPANPKNKRTRASLLIQAEGQNFLIDTAPEMREQLIREKIHRIDAVLYTHDHADHVHGIDDLRQLYFTYKEKIPIYGDQKTLERLRISFSYLFDSGPDVPKIYQSFLVTHEIKPSFSLGALDIQCFEQDHGYSTSLGYRFGSLAYSTDVVRLSEKAFRMLEGVDTWIVDCLCHEEKPTHSHLSQTLEWIERVKPRRAILTHLNHTMDYERLRKELPVSVEPAYDGMALDFSCHKLS